MEVLAAAPLVGPFAFPSLGVRGTSSKGTSSMPSNASAAFTSLFVASWGLGLSAGVAEALAAVPFDPKKSAAVPPPAARAATGVGSSLAGTEASDEETSAVLSLTPSVIPVVGT